MEFKEFKEKLQKHVSKMLKNHTSIFVTGTDKHVLWNMYLDSFPPGTNELYRERKYYDCCCCRHFIYIFGNVVVIDNNKLVSIWDFSVEDDTFQPVVDALSNYVKSVPIVDLFVTKEAFFGTDKNFEQLQDGKVHTWNHFRIDLPKKFVSRSSETVATIQDEYRSTKNVFKRSFEEISKDSLETVIDLISQNSLHRGLERFKLLKEFLILHNEYHSLPDEEKDNYCWVQSIKYGAAVGKIRNHLIGSLLTDITKGTDLNIAVTKYEAKAGGPNYKRSKPIYSKKQAIELEKALTNGGYIESLGRMFATIEDMTINNILFANKSSLKKMSGGIFDELQKGATTPSPKKFDKIQEIPIEDFIKKILPRTTNIELYVENKHEPNFMSVIGPKVKDSKIMLKWDNRYTWAYSKNMTESMKELVKKAGGRVDGVLRYTIRWNKDTYNPNDFDAHCKEPNGNHIFFQTKYPKIHPSSGRLDVDIINPKKNVPAVENITWLDINKMQEGTYKFYTHCYSHNGGHDGFEAELEYDGQIYYYNYDKELRPHQNVDVVTLEFSRRNGIKIIKSLPDSLSSKNIWNLQTNQFHPVSVCMFSPNYWDEQCGVGHKHYFFILKNCINDTQPNGFFNEFLKEELLKKYKRAFEALGSKMRVEPSDNQLSGLGFSSTKRDSVICKLEGHVARIVKIVF